MLCLPSLAPSLAWEGRGQQWELFHLPGGPGLCVVKTFALQLWWMAVAVKSWLCWEKVAWTGGPECRGPPCKEEIINIPPCGENKTLEGTLTSKWTVAGSHSEPP